MKQSSRIHQRKENRYTAELETKDKILNSIYKISGLLTKLISLDKILTSIVEETSRVFGYSRIALFLLDREKRLLECKYLIGFSPPEMKRAFSNPFNLERHDCLETMVVETGETIYIKDHQKDRRLTRMDRVISRLNRRVSTVAVPLKIKRDVIGLIEADKNETRLQLTQKDIRLFSIFANHASMIIENARLYEASINERNFAHNIQESTPNGLIAVNCNCVITTINRKAEILFGLTRHNVLGMNVSDVFEARITEPIHRAMDDFETINNQEIDIQNKNGNRIILGLSTSLIRNKDDIAIGVLVLFSDLTETKKTEELIRRMDRLTSLGQLSAGIAHEIRNPLASINFNVQMLGKQMSSAMKEKTIIEDTLVGIERIKKLVKGIHDFAKPGSPLLNKGNINHVIVDSISLLNPQLKKNKIKTYVNLQEEIPPVIFDRLKMQQVFINLIINAMEAMPEGGLLKINSAIDNHYKNDSGQLVISFADNGIGIPSQHYSKIFDPFFTTKPEGTGLGLSIAHKIIEQHNALIEVESAEKKGTTFIIKIPLNTGMNDEASLQSTDHR